MNLIDEYRKQWQWRDWDRVFDALPLTSGQTVLDLGCGPGDQGAALEARGARVFGADANQELLRAAAIDCVRAHLRALPFAPADGIWSSFAAAYFPGDFSDVLRGWKQHARHWIALVEIDDLFGHEPLSATARGMLDAYARESKFYDFHMGHKLRTHLETAGFRVTQELTIPDLELSFDGPARPDVLEGWRARFTRMKLQAVADDFLACLSDPNHRSSAKVYACIAAL
jgi:SAM-dependent methyltransferase